MKIGTAYGRASCSNIYHRTDSDTRKTYLKPYFKNVYVQNMRGNQEGYIIKNN